MKILNFVINSFTQIRKLYKIKQILTSINEYKAISGKGNNEVQYTDKLTKLKSQIFECGFLYVKFFQWYISKLKSDIIQSNVKTEQNYTDDEVENMCNFISHFEDIFEQCPYHDIEATQQTFQEMMSGVLLEEFVDIATLKPIASGSIGQVYYARLKTDSETQIAIKVKHPNIDDELEEQQNIINIIRYLQSIPFFRKRYNLFFNIDDFLKDLTLQCDFNNEAKNVKQFIENFADSSQYVKFPEVIFASRDMLISEYIEGDAFETLTEFQRGQISLTFLCFFYQMLIIDNFIHGDLHCKNWKVRLNPDSLAKNPQIVVYDCGICFSNIDTRLTKDFWIALGKYDVLELAKTIRQFIISSKYQITIDDLEREIIQMLRDLDTNFLGTQMLLRNILNFFTKHDIIVHKFLLNLTITMCLIEEFLKKTDIIDKDTVKCANIYDAINASQLDVVAFTRAKGCFPRIKELFEVDMDNKFKQYNENIVKNGVELELETGNVENKLFHILETTKLKFRPPCDI